MHRLAALALAALAGCSLIVDPVSGGPHPDILVNSITLDSQANVAAAFTGDQYFVVWQDASKTPPDTESKAIRGRFLSKTGEPQAAEQLINVTTAGSQDHPQIARQGSTLLVVWTDSGTGSALIKGRELSPLGTFLSDEKLIADAGPGSEADQQVIAAPNNQFLVVWTDSHMTAPDIYLHAIYACLFDTAAGMCAGSQLVNTMYAGDQIEPQAARGTDDQMLVVWTDIQAADGGDIRGRMLATNGAPIGSDFIINTTTQLVQEQPYALPLAAGGYLVAWTDGSQTDGDTDGKAIRARLLDASGQGLGNDFVLNARTRGDQAHPRLIQLPNGSIFLSFEDGSMLAPDTHGNGVRERRLAADGTPDGEEHEANTYYVDDQEDTALAADLDGNVLLLWEDGGGSPPDNSSDSVRARLYAPGN